MNNLNEQLYRTTDVETSKGAAIRAANFIAYSRDSERTTYAAPIYTSRTPTYSMVPQLQMHSHPNYPQALPSGPVTYTFQSIPNTINYSGSPTGTNIPASYPAPTITVPVHIHCNCCQQTLGRVEPMEIDEPREEVPNKFVAPANISIATSDAYTLGGNSQNASRYCDCPEILSSLKNVTIDSCTSTSDLCAPNIRYKSSSDNAIKKTLSTVIEEKTTVDCSTSTSDFSVPDIKHQHHKYGEDSLQDSDYPQKKTELSSSFSTEKTSSASSSDLWTTDKKHQSHRSKEGIFGESQIATENLSSITADGAAIESSESELSISDNKHQSHRPEEDILIDSETMFSFSKTKSSFGITSSNNGVSKINQLETNKDILSTAATEKIPIDKFSLITEFSKPENQSPVRSENILKNSQETKKSPNGTTFNISPSKSESTQWSLHSKEDILEIINDILPSHSSEKESIDEPSQYQSKKSEEDIRDSGIDRESMSSISTEKNIPKNFASNNDISAPHSKYESNQLEKDLTGVSGSLDTISKTAHPLSTEKVPIKRSAITFSASQKEQLSEKNTSKKNSSRAAVAASSSAGMPTFTQERATNKSNVKNENTSRWSIGGKLKKDKKI